MAFAPVWVERPDVSSSKPDASNNASKSACDICNYLLQKSKLTVAIDGFVLLWHHRYMISRHHRFHGRAGLRKVFQNGSGARGRTMALRYSYAPNRPTSRVAVIVAKKIFKSAVKRNRIRRRIFNIVRHELSTLQPGTDMVITVLTPDVLTMPHSELVSELTKLLSRLPRRSNLSWQDDIIERY